MQKTVRGVVTALLLVAAFAIGHIAGTTASTPPQGEITIQDGRICQEYDQTPSNITPHLYKQAIIVWVGCTK